MMAPPAEILPLPDMSSPARFEDPEVPTLADPPRILVVDDDQGFREMLRDFLLDDGFDVAGEAPDGVEAVTAAERLQPEVVVMDMRMPRMDGLEATRLIRAALPTTQVVILSAYEDQALKRGADQLGAYAYLIKGCPPSTLVDTLRAACSFNRKLEHAWVLPLDPSNGSQSGSS
jgi:DNA-binding NarL/FixJ family response regulator